MPTKYNVLLKMDKKEPRMPQDLFNRACEDFRKKGFLGVKHINHFGRVFNGYDPNCEDYREASFDIFLRKYGELNDLNMREIFEQAKITTSGFDDKGMELLEHGEFIVDSLERLDPLADLPIGIYSNLPGIESMEIQTCCGRQGTHAHIMSLI